MIFSGFALALTLVSGCDGATAVSSVPQTHEVTIQASGGNLHATITTGGSPEDTLIAIHGGPGNSSDYMASLHRLATERLAVVTYDQRGVGESTAPGGGFAMEDYLSDLDAIRQFVGVPRVHLLAHSWGGLIAQRYAIEFPQHVRSVIFVGSGIFSSEAYEEGRRVRGMRIAELQERGIIPNPLTSLTDILPAYFSDPLFDLPDEMKDMFYDPTVEQRTWSALDDYDFSAGIDRFAAPVLVIYGEDDPYGFPLAQSTTEALPASMVTVTMIENCGHYWQEQKDEFLAIVAQFLSNGENAASRER